MCGQDEACLIAKREDRRGVLVTATNLPICELFQWQSFRLPEQTIHDAASSLQLCAGIEAPVHPMRETFLKKDIEAVLLVDASNAFISLSRKAALFCFLKLYPTYFA